MKKINVKGPIVSNATADLYEWFGWDATGPNVISKGLEEAAGDDVLIEINSPGGVCVYGYEMYKSIMDYEGKVTVHVISAMSAATLLVCAADEALISDAGVFMIHNAQAMVEGDYRDMQMEADALVQFNEGIINAYVRKTGKSREDIQKLMDMNTYMAPERAIANGFVDGYIYGEPEGKCKEKQNLATQIVASAVCNIIPEEKAMELMAKIKASADEQGKENRLQFKDVLSETEKAVPQAEGSEKSTFVTENKKTIEQIIAQSDSDRDKEGGKGQMTLAEFLNENPEARTEVENMTAEARAEGAKAERERIKSLDEISNHIKPEVLNDAKYGENPIDGQTLAYQAMVAGDKLATSYMDAAKKDSKESNVENVGVGNVDAGQEETDESDDMASYINAMKGGK